jgi:hypothetical protein
MKANEIKDRRQPIVDQSLQVKKNIQQTENQLKNLDSASGQQEHKLGQRSHDTLKAYKWLLENQDKFEQEVFGPPIITCSITDPKFADAVESLFQRTDLTCFTTQNRRDFRTLQDWLIGSLKLHDISMRTCTQSLATFTGSMSNDELTRWGFDGWASEFLVGPDPVLAMLCSEKNLHATPIALKEISDEVFNQLEHSSISSWVAEKNSFQVTRRREYGPGATSTRVREIRPATTWTSQPVDATLKQRHQENIVLYNEQLQGLIDKLDSEKEAISKLREEHARCSREIVICIVPLVFFFCLFIY